MDETRFCTSCSETKPLVEFGSRKGRNGVVRPTYCKVCLAKKAREARNTEAYKTWHATYGQSDSRKASNKRRDQSEKGKACRKRYATSAKGKAQTAAATREWKTQPGVRAQISMQEALRRMIIIPGYDSSLLKVMNCTREQFVAHLEVHWDDGMSWENYGYQGGDYTMGWDVDHTIPKSAYDHSDPEEARKAWDLRNLKPMWHAKNLQKTNRLCGWKDVPAELWPKNHFPDAYAGQNTKIRDTLNNLILKSPQNWQTSVGLPFFQIQGTVVEWDEVRFDVRLMQRVPYEGVSRMQTSLRRKHRDRVVRRGLALIIESDFYATDAGRQHFADQLTSIRYCVQETCNFDALYAYLSTSNYDFNYDRAKNLRPKRNIKTAMNHEIMLYGIAQKEQLGFDKAVEECKYRMSRYGVQPNMLVLPPQMLLYMALAPEQKLTYKEGGPAAEARFDAGVAGFEARAFRGCGVFTSEPFEVSDDADSVQMLTRSSQIGEFYVMSPPQVPPMGDSTKYTCNMMVYDEEKDQHVHVTWDDAVAACCIGDLTGDPNISCGNGVVMPASEWLNRAGKIKDVNDGKAGYDTLDATDLSIRIVVARPFIEHLMHNVIMAVAGRETGATLFGPADMQLSANTQVKTIEGHYTGHFKAVVTKPQNVLIMRDVACAGYVAGANTRWFAKKDDGTGYDLETAAASMMSRLSFDDDVTDKYDSMLAFPCCEGQFTSGQLDTVMSVTSRILPWEVTGSSSAHDSFPGGNEMYRAYKGKLNLEQVHYGEDMKAAENQDFISQGSTNNATCFLGPHRKYDPFTKTFMSLTPGQGHFGPDAIPGDARWRRGESVSLKTARDSMTSLELAQHAQMVYSGR